MNFAGLRALVVDDNASNRAILQQHLESLGIEVVAAETSAAALAALSAEEGARFIWAWWTIKCPAWTEFNWRNSSVKSALVGTAAHFAQHARRP